MVYSLVGPRHLKPPLPMACVRERIRHE
uniref:Uncharacterized protein n=1 Tax=Anguilla anguilla TaxID=7936 RepID=A0A0E9RX12_ANGAN